MTNKTDRIKYKRLTRQKSSFLFPSSLWLGPDHLLLVISWSVVEEYKRFYFEDIQSVTITETRTWKIFILVTGILGGVSALSALLTSGGLAVFFWTMTGFNIIIFLINLHSGPSCYCYIQTAVQREKLYSISRVRTFQKVAAVIKPLIEQTQERLEPEVLEQYISGLKNADSDSAEML
ncbi:MAG: hypothetical protein GY749_24265 [Desulfobacteraceae bacterium]|nr:hypothetical protein [Desulfobacteraceae bacterium]